MVPRKLDILTIISALNKNIFKRISLQQKTEPSEQECVAGT